MDDQLNELQIENLKSISKNQLSNDEKSTLLLKVFLKFFRIILNFCL